jgi:hypothetical protein
LFGRFSPNKCLEGDPIWVQPDNKYGPITNQTDLGLVNELARKQDLSVFKRVTLVLNDFINRQSDRGDLRPEGERPTTVGQASPSQRGPRSRINDDVPVSREEFLQVFCIKIIGEPSIF